MESQDLKRRIRDDEPNIDNNMNNSSKGRRQKRTAMAKRGLRSLVVAVTVPLTLTLADVSLFGSSHSYRTSAKPFWFPPLWALNLIWLASSFFMGLSAWLVWAEGGFHRKPMGLALYVGQLALSLAWDPIVFRMEANRVGLVVSLAMFGTLLGCCRIFRDVNPIAGDLVKPCLAWAAFLSIVNFKLINP